jgi:hypothetical protein
MDDLAALPDDIDTLKAALAMERARVHEVVAARDAGAAELAIARAKASEDLALIAHQKLRIAQLERPALRTSLGTVGAANRSVGAAVRGICSERQRG